MLRYLQPVCMYEFVDKRYLFKACMYTYIASALVDHNDLIPRSKLTVWGKYSQFSWLGGLASSTPFILHFQISSKYNHNLCNSLN